MVNGFEGRLLRERVGQELRWVLPQLVKRFSDMYEYARPLLALLLTIYMSAHVPNWCGCAHKVACQASSNEGLRNPTRSE